MEAIACERGLKHSDSGGDSHGRLSAGGEYGSLECLCGRTHAMVGRIVTRYRTWEGLPSLGNGAKPHYCLGRNMLI